MLKNLKRENLWWLASLGLLMLFTLFSGSTLAFLFILAGFLLAILLSLRNFPPGNLFRNLLKNPQSAVSGPSSAKQTRAAKEAAARARARGGIIPSEITMLKIGLIAHKAQSDKPVILRESTVRSNLHAIRPYITLELPAGVTERHALLRFSFQNPNSQECYVHEMETWLAVGQQDIYPSDQMPIHETDIQFGDWHLEIQLDGRLIAEHGFRVSPSSGYRRRRLTSSDNPPDEEPPLDASLAGDD